MRNDHEVSGIVTPKRAATQKEFACSFMDAPNALRLSASSRPWCSRV
jgi:hypothetical protein